MEGEVEIGTGFGLEAASEATGRIVRIAGKEQGAGALADYVQLVWVIPEMDGLFTGPAAERRRFLDRLMLAIDPKMRGPRARFDRAMRQRNRLFQMRRGIAVPVRRARGADGGGRRGHRRGEARCGGAALRADRDDPRRAQVRRPSPGPLLNLEGTLEAALVERPAIEVEDDYVSLLQRDPRARPLRRPGPCGTRI